MSKKRSGKGARLREERRPRQLTIGEVEQAIGPLSGYVHRCHSASLALVRSGLISGRVARGWCRPYVLGQHSWVVLGPNPYARDVRLLDVTLWSYDDRFPKIYYCGNLKMHQPHGAGPWQDASHFPMHHGGPSIMPKRELSDEAKAFIWRFSRSGELDARGWIDLAKLPVEGWPAREIIEAMLDTPALKALVPIDIAGMLTDRNPGRLYLSEGIPLPVDESLEYNEKSTTKDVGR